MTQVGDEWTEEAWHATILMSHKEWDMTEHSAFDKREKETSARIDKTFGLDFHFWFFYYSSVYSWWFSQGYMVYPYTKGFPKLAFICSITVRFFHLWG